MAIRLKLENGSTVEADSVEELVTYQRALEGRRRNPPSKPARIQKQAVLPLGDEELPEPARKLVDILLPFPNGLQSAKIAQELNVSPRGVGGYVTALTSWAKRRGMNARQLLDKGRHSNGGGGMVRTLSISKSFRKMIQEGQVPGMKLDT
jgi:hypothetical protein